MKFKILGKIISILCATCISTSVATSSVGAVKTRNEDPKWKERINKLNVNVKTIKDHIRIYRDRLNKPEVGDDSEEFMVKVVKVSELLFKIEEMLNKLSDLNLDNEEIFNLDRFADSFKNFKSYMQDRSILGPINLDKITEEIVGIENDDEHKGIDIDYWNKLIEEVKENNNINYDGNDDNNNINNIINNNNNINNIINDNNNINNIINNNNNINNIINNNDDDELIQNILQKFKILDEISDKKSDKKSNEKSNEILDGILDEAVATITNANFHSAEKRVEVCLKILNKINYNEDHYRKFEDILQSYVDSYLINSLNEKLRFINNAFARKNTLMITFNQFRQASFVVGVRADLMEKLMGHPISQVKYEKVDFPGISDTIKLNRLIDKTLIEIIANYKIDHDRRELMESLSEILEFKSMIDYLQSRTIANNGRQYDSNDLNFVAKQLNECVELFAKLIDKLTSVNVRPLSDILSLSDADFEDRYPSDEYTDEVKVTRLARMLAKPLIEIMEVAVNKKLLEINLAFNDEEKQNVLNLFAKLNQNLRYLCSGIRIINNDYRFEMEYLPENIKNDDDESDDKNDVDVNDNGWAQNLNQNIGIAQNLNQNIGIVNNVNIINSNSDIIIDDNNNNNNDDEDDKDDKDDKDNEDNENNENNDDNENNDNDDNDDNGNGNIIVHKHDNEIRTLNNQNENIINIGSFRINDNILKLDPFKINIDPFKLNLDPFKINLEPLKISSDPHRNHDMLVDAHNRRINNNQNENIINSDPLRIHDMLVDAHNRRINNNQNENIINIAPLRINDNDNVINGDNEIRINDNDNVINGDNEIRINDNDNVINGDDEIRINNNNIINGDDIDMDNDEDRKHFAFNLGYGNALRFQNKEGFGITDLDEQYSRGFDQGLNDLKNKDLNWLLEKIFHEQYPTEDSVSVMNKIFELRKNEGYEQKATAVLNVLKNINDLNNRMEFQDVLVDLVNSYTDVYLDELKNSPNMDQQNVNLLIEHIKSKKDDISNVASLAIMASELPNRFDSLEKFEVFLYGQLFTLRANFMPHQ